MDCKLFQDSLLYLATLEELWRSCSPSSSLEIFFTFSFNKWWKNLSKTSSFCRKKKNIPQNYFLNVHNMLFSMYFVAKIHQFGAVCCLKI
jgi:hypothetical protein